MSGHSHFKTVAATKNANDAKRGKIFSKIARVITIAVKEKGKDPSVNPGLKSAIEKAREFNMPKENIERAIKKGTGELAGEDLEEVSFEGLGPGGMAIIIDGITDNKNRTLGEIRSILTQYDGKIAGEGAVRWMFERRGIVLVKPGDMPKETAELEVIEAGADDVAWQDASLEIYTKPESLDAVKKALEEKGLKPEEFSLGWFAKEEISLDEKAKEKAQKLFEALDENDAVQDIYSNAKV
jgi:YebC/PmpR family DNA-binding regulatory protein